MPQWCRSWWPQQQPSWWQAGLGLRPQSGSKQPQASAWWTAGTVTASAAQATQLVGDAAVRALKTLLICLSWTVPSLQPTTFLFNAGFTAVDVLGHGTMGHVVAVSLQLAAFLS